MAFYNLFPNQLKHLDKIHFSIIIKFSFTRDILMPPIDLLSLSIFTSDLGPCLLKLYQKYFRQLMFWCMKARCHNKKRAKICHRHAFLRDCDCGLAADFVGVVEKPFVDWVPSCVHAQCVDARCCCAWTFANKKGRVLVCLDAFAVCEPVDWSRIRTIFRKKDTSVSFLQNKINKYLLITSLLERRGN